MSLSVVVDERVSARMADELESLMVRLRRTLRRKVREEIQPEPLHGPAVELLQVVRSHPGVRVGEAARRLALAPNTASTLTQELADAGLVERRNDHLDRRIIRLTLTQAGGEQLAAIRKSRQAALATALRALSSADRRALRSALSALGRLVDELEPSSS
jgi:DNA-binding MarR family transcriptional regulator